MKFKKSDIEGLKKGRMTEPTIILPSGEAEDSPEDSEVLLVEEDTSETLLDIDDLDTDSSASVPTVDFTSDGPTSDELSFEQDSSSYVLESADDVLINSSQELSSVDDDLMSDSYLDSDTGMQTEPIDMGDSDALGDSSMDADESVDDDMGHTQPMDESHVDEMTGESIYSDGTHEVTLMQREEPISGGLAAAIIITTLVMLYSGIVMLNVHRTVDNSITSGLTNTMYGFIPAQHLVKRSKASPSDIKRHITWRKNRLQKQSRSR
jgi:hypothetical protein